MVLRGEERPEGWWRAGVGWGLQEARLLRDIPGFVSGFSVLFFFFPKAREGNRCRQS